MKVFLAGASGVIGQRLAPLLREAGMTVVGTTRSPEKTDQLRALGIEPVVLDMFDADAVLRTVMTARPDFVIHQLTDLPKVSDPAALEAARPRNARLREVTTPILMRAAQAAGARRAVVQSICFVYAGGNPPHIETDPIASPSIQVLERATLTTSGVEGVVLRFGRLWGPGTWAEKPDGLAAPLHIDAAAQATLLALTRGTPGIYNIAENDGTVSSIKATRELGFDSSFRLRP